MPVTNIFVTMCRPPHRHIGGYATGYATTDVAPIEAAM
jgi:hypothetical protein